MAKLVVNDEQATVTIKCNNLSETKETAVKMLNIFLPVHPIGVTTPDELVESFIIGMSVNLDKIGCIKALRILKPGIGLKDAKDYVEAMVAKHNLYYGDQDYFFRG